MQRYYIADPHFGHANIIHMTKRPFATVEAMDQAMIDAWNERVTDEDEVYIIGDLIYRSRFTAGYYLSQLKGSKHLILGNHDKWLKPEEHHHFFESISHIKELTDEGKYLVLCHYPLAEWPGFHRNSLHIFGHIHNTREGDAFRYYQGNTRMLNAGVDINHYAPVRLQELIDNNEKWRRE
ncbi:metallophosphoesterase family protein [Paenibacillus tepidiphilus]|uniref:metallophosphoesterase family protein n=1 Tax=Paenibacillus tepidiphilus TaxID=2608683 RepID=UPI001238C36F|nr:metallophosphoesterase family protein [Paenibacillus tepidiphilus]